MLAELMFCAAAGAANATTADRMRAIGRMNIGNLLVRPTYAVSVAGDYGSIWVIATAIAAVARLKPSRYVLLRSPFVARRPSSRETPSSREGFNRAFRVADRSGATP